MSNKNNSSQINVGARLREFRKSKGMNGNDFAELCGISQGALSGLENGKSYPSAETIISLLNKTDVDIKWLLTGKKETQVERDSYLNEIEMWIDEELKIDRRVKSWFQIQFEELFPRFTKWKEEKKREEEGRVDSSIQKVA